MKRLALRKSKTGNALLALLATAGCGSSRAASAYDEVVAPILRARCTECHGEQKQKAKLALHSFEALMRGSDGGPVLVAGKPGESVLLERLRLPLDDDEHMPPSDKPQPAPAEIALLTRWIERGASATSSVAELALPADLAAAAAELPTKLPGAPKADLDPVWEFDPAAVERARAPFAAKVAELQRQFPGALSYESRTATTLSFTAAAFGRQFGDRELALLAPLGAELVELDLSSTAVSERSAALWKNFGSLRTLRASFTELGDETVAVLAALPKLESVTLTGTKVGPASVNAFKRLPALRVLRLVDTAAESAAVEAKLPVETPAVSGTN